MEIVYFCSTQHLLGQLEGQGLKSPESLLAHRFACHVNWENNQMEAGIAGVPLDPPLTPCSLSMHSLQHGRFQVPGPRDHKAQATRKRIRSKLLPFIVSPWKSPITSSSDSTDLPGLKEWEPRPQLTSHWRTVKPHCKSREEWVQIGGTVFGKYNQPQLVLMQ